MSSVTVENLRCEFLVDPSNVHARQPRLSWVARGDRPATAHQVIVSDDRDQILGGRGEIWDTGRVQFPGASGVVYQGPPVPSRARRWWAVRTWQDTGEPSDWSAPAHWVQGLLDETDWRGARWIHLPNEIPETMRLRPSPQVRRTFTIDRPISRAMLHVTALGLYRAFINEARVGNDEFRPGWTDYETRVAYQTYDVTELLRVGVNVLGAVLGDGWYAGCAPYSTRVRRRGGVRPRLLAQLFVEHRDGEPTVVVSDGSWRGSHGPIRASDRYLGEVYDARYAAAAWLAPSFDESKWPHVAEGETPDGRVVATGREPVRVVEQMTAKSVTEPLLPGMVRIVDFGQNVVGWVRLRVRGFPGLEVTLRHGEMLDADGTLYTTNLWDPAMQTDTYVCATAGEEVWEPWFTIHGFRYLELSGYPGELGLDDVVAVVAHNDMAPTGVFETSSELVNAIQRNVVWTQRGNFVEVPTDCPQRTERLGWLGDAQLFAPTAVFNYDCAALLRDWLVDIRATQSTDGAFPNVTPTEGAAALPTVGAPGWGDAGVILPWLHYVWYGDIRILEENYTAMSRWVDYLEQRSDGWIYDPDHAWGDWLAVPESQYAATRKDVLGTLYFSHSARLVSRAGAALGREDAAAAHATLADKVGEAFVAAFVDADGRIEGGTQTLYALALRFGVLPATLRSRAVAHLAGDIEDRGHLTTGIVGTAHVLHALSDHGHLDLAYRMVERVEYPSWGYSIRNGATTIWERWDGWTEDRGFQTPAMNSFNHYALGAVGSWLYRVVVGIDLQPSSPGFRRFTLRPRPGGTLQWARATLESAAGRIESGWNRHDDAVDIEVAVPPAAMADVALPDGRVETVGPGRHAFRNVALER